MPLRLSRRGDMARVCAARATTRKGVGGADEALAPWSRAMRREAALVQAAREWRAVLTLRAWYARRWRGEGWLGEEGRRAARWCRVCEGCCPKAAVVVLPRGTVRPTAEAARFADAMCAEDAMGCPVPARGAFYVSCGGAEGGGGAARVRRRSRPETVGGAGLKRVRRHAPARWNVAPEPAVGTRVEVWWDEDEEWWAGLVVDVDRDGEGWAA